MQTQEKEQDVTFPERGQGESQIILFSSKSKGKLPALITAI